MSAMNSVMDDTPMPYTYKSVGFFWLITSALVAASASGVAGGWWFVLLLATAFAVPALALRSPALAAIPPHERPLIMASRRDGSPVDLGAIEISEWENEGGSGTVRGLSSIARRARRDGGYSKPGYRVDIPNQE
jgi:hypothetical protein